MASLLAALMFAAIGLLLPLGFPVGFTVLGVAIGFAALGQLFGVFNVHLLSALPLRVLNLMNNDLLQAVPLFIYMGAVMERTKMSRDLFTSLGALFGPRPAGLAIATLLLGLLLAPATGAIGATVVALGLLALPPMLEARYDRPFALGVTAAVGTLGTVLPPSLILILLGDQMRIAQSDAQRLLVQAPAAPLLLSKLYVGMVLPVVLVITGYATILLWRALRSPESCPGRPSAISARRAAISIVPPFAIIATTLVLIVSGKLYTVEAAAAAAVAMTLWALVRREMSLRTLAEIVRLVTRVAGAIFLLIMGANTFSLVFRGFAGDVLVREAITGSFSSPTLAVPVVFGLLLVFGFFLDALEIIFLVVPIAIPPLIVLGGDPLWLAVLVGVTLQTSFLLPPSGFALFFARSVAPKDVSMTTIYRGVRPFVLLQIAVLLAVLLLPGLATWLPGRA